MLTFHERFYVLDCISDGLFEEQSLALLIVSQVHEMISFTDFNAHISFNSSTVGKTRTMLYANLNSPHVLNPDKLILLLNWSSSWSPTLLYLCIFKPICWSLDVSMLILVLKWHQLISSPLYSGIFKVSFVFCCSVQCVCSSIQLFILSSVKYERIKFLVIALHDSVEIYAWAPKPYHKFMAFKVSSVCPLILVLSVVRKVLKIHKLGHTRRERFFFF